MEAHVLIDGMVLLALIHAAIGMLTTAANLLVNQGRSIRVARNDSERLRLAIAAELVNLKDLYKENIDAIYAGKDVLVSSRLFVAIYRGNLGRLHTLDARDIPGIVTAYAMCERVEALAAAHCKAHGQGAFGLGKDRPFADDLVAAYEKAAAAAERTLKAMSEVSGARLVGLETSARLGQEARAAG
jgi:hypothetical protein